MAMGRRNHTDLGIVELAVDPADVDRDTYPVKIRLTRALTAYEVSGLADDGTGHRADGDAIVIPRARLDDVAREYDLGPSRLERVQSRAEELEGETWIGGQPPCRRAGAARVAPAEPADRRPRASLSAHSPAGGAG